MAEFQANDQIDSMRGYHAVGTKHFADVENAKAARFQKSAEEWWAVTHQFALGVQAELGGVICNKTMTASQEFQREFTFADSAGASEQNAQAKQLHEHAVERDGVWRGGWGGHGCSSLGS
jgi:hypothetical protein